MDQIDNSNDGVNRLERNGQISLVQSCTHIGGLHRSTHELVHKNESEAFKGLCLFVAMVVVVVVVVVAVVEK